MNIKGRVEKGEEVRKTIELYMKEGREYLCLNYGEKLFLANGDVYSIPLGWMGGQIDKRVDE
jgi:hypothetical protein